METLKHPSTIISVGTAIGLVVATWHHNKQAHSQETNITSMLTKQNTDNNVKIALLEKQTKLLKRRVNQLSDELEDSQDTVKRILSALKKDGKEIDPPQNGQQISQQISTQINSQKRRNRSDDDDDDEDDKDELNDLRRARSGRR